jgi:hypothetical protein
VAAFRATRRFKTLKPVAGIFETSAAERAVLAGGAPGIGVASSARMQSKSLRAILVAGLLAGALDLTAAFIQAGLGGRGPERVLYAIASGLLGADAFEGGVGTAALGAVLHFVIALGAAAVYVGASRKLTSLIEQPVICGLVYGIVVWSFMNLVVLPLSAVPFKTVNSVESVRVSMAILMVCVGLPIALTARRLLRST